MEETANQQAHRGNRPGWNKRNTMVYSIVALLIVAGVLYYVIGMNHPVALDGQPVSLADMQGLQAAALNSTLATAVGAGSTANYPKQITDNSPLLMVNGKPNILYIGAEYCPYCAETRWGLILALMRFGNFTGLNYMSSTSTDVYPNTPTFSFVNSSYSSRYISFSSVEIQDRNGSSLQTPTNFQDTVATKYGTGGIPFIDMFNRSIQDGASASPQVLDGQSWQQLIAALNNPDSNVAQAVIGNANVFTAYICSEANITAPVCSMPYVKGIRLS